MGIIPNETQPPNEDVLNKNSSIRRSAEPVSKAALVQHPPLPGKSSWVRLLALPASIRWGLTVGALLLLIGGALFMYSALKPSPHPVTYQRAQGTIEGFWSSVTVGSESNPQTVKPFGLAS